MTGLEAVIGLSLVATALVFGIGFRFGLAQVRSRDAERGLPRAVIAAGDARWLAGKGRQRWLERVPTFQAALVAVGVTSIFLMALCFVAMVVIVIVGA
jgi:hypothetical protein